MPERISKKPRGSTRTVAVEQRKERPLVRASFPLSPPSTPARHQSSTIRLYRYWHKALSGNGSGTKASLCSLFLIASLLLPFILVHFIHPAALLVHPLATSPRRHGQTSNIYTANLLAAFVSNNQHLSLFSRPSPWPTILQSVVGRQKLPRDTRSTSTP